MVVYHKGTKNAKKVGQARMNTKEHKEYSAGGI